MLEGEHVRQKKENLKAKTIQLALHKTPFKPFFLQVDNGTKVKVEHSECFLFNGRKSECIIAQGKDDFHYLDLSHLGGLSYIQNGKKHARSRK